MVEFRKTGHMHAYRQKKKILKDIFTCTETKHFRYLLFLVEGCIQKMERGGGGGGGCKTRVLRI